jgi:hypothetical protein
MRHAYPHSSKVRLAKIQKPIAERSPRLRFAADTHRIEVKLNGGCFTSSLRSQPLPRNLAGEMAEWLKAHAWKACLLERVTWVRIPLSPPVLKH